MKPRRTRKGEQTGGDWRRAPWQPGKEPSVKHLATGAGGSLFTTSGLRVGTGEEVRGVVCKPGHAVPGSLRGVCSVKSYAGDVAVVRAI